MYRFLKLAVITALSLCVAQGIAYADQGGIPHNPHEAKHTTTIGVTNEDGLTGTFDTSTVGSWDEITGENGQLQFVYDFYDPNGYDIIANDGTTVLGTIFSLNYVGEPDPQVIVNFSVRAGAKASTFSFLSGIDVVPQLTNPLAKASASLTLTDNSVPANGAYVTGSFGNKAYRASYNNGTVFSDLVNSFSILGGSQTNSENYPLDGISFMPVPGTVTHMEAEYRFVLKAYDSASGTSNFVMIPNEVPEPGSVAALATGMTALLGVALKRKK